MDATRESRILSAMVGLADTLVAGYDVVELLQTLADECGELVGSGAAGIVLADPAGRLEVIASSDEDAGFVEVLQLAAGEGPCIDCYESGRPVTVSDLSSEVRWSTFSTAALGHGYRSVQAYPMRLRQVTIGSLNLFANEPGTMALQDANAAQALADMATIGILQGRAIEEASRLSIQLQHALDSRVAIEQAKGFVAYRNDISPSEAFTLIRSHARSTRTPLSELARQIIARQIEL